MAAIADRRSVSRGRLVTYSQARKTAAAALMATSAQRPMGNSPIAEPGLRT